jgi:Ni,Fe-hydrogenase III small subunit/formate hydrogenlyase subunit 6/NADH:ubiquinone oxidoreductase subunit I
MLKPMGLGVLRKGIVTSGYPKERYEPCDGHQGMPSVDPSKCRLHQVCIEACPTSAIFSGDGAIHIDLGACIFCGECSRSCPEGAISITKEYELASRDRRNLIVPATGDSEPSIEDLGHRLEAKVKKAFGRSLSIREVDAGSCNGCEVEVNSLTNAIHDIERFGLHIVASPRHADLLLVTGPVTRNMEPALIRTYKAVPDPKLVMAMGACACSGGIFKDSYASGSGVASVLPVDVYIPGCPPRPQAIIYAFMLATDRIQARKRP